MNVLMYPIAPEDDFPDEFCAIRQGSGEHWFYTPAGEDASWMLFRAESENAKMRHDLEEANNQAEEVCIENAKLRELVQDMWPHVRHRSRMCSKCDLPCDTSDECLLYEPMRQRMHDLGVEVDG